MKNSTLNLLNVALMSRIVKQLNNLQLTGSNKEEREEDEPLIEITPISIKTKTRIIECSYTSKVGACRIYCGENLAGECTGDRLYIDLGYSWGDVSWNDNNTQLSLRVYLNDGGYYLPAGATPLTQYVKKLALNFFIYTASASVTIPLKKFKDIGNSIKLYSSDLEFENIDLVK